MTVDIMKAPSNTAAKIVLDAGEGLTAEGGSMIAMSAGLSLDTRISRKEGGGLLKGLARRLGGEGIFMNHYSAGSGGGEVYLAPSLPGDMAVIELDGSRNLRVQNSSFLAHGEGVDMQIRWEGFKNAFSGESMIWLDLSGRGKAVINAFGMIYPVDVDGEYIVDTGNIAAFEDSLNFKISKAGSSWVSSFMGGEGLVCRFEGKGRLWCQTHADRAFGHALSPFLTPKTEN
jgi:uncharacterized protein (TIGR00266 family)